MLGLVVGIILGAAGVVLYRKYQQKKLDMGLTEQGDPWWTVVGVWHETKERYTLFVQAPTAREAEDLAQWEAQQNAAELWVVGVFAGKQDSADYAYATFVDPDVKRADWLNTEKGRAFGDEPKL